MVTVRLTEMYDMKTTANKIGIIGIHTPNRQHLINRWIGLCLNYQKYRLVGCSIRLACASTMPVDPLQVSASAGESTIAPQDIMNPILYRAVSNDTWNGVIARLYASSGADMDTGSAKVFNDGFSSVNDHFGLYYNLLASDGWRKAMPQNGLSMSSLVPMCYSVLSQYGDGVLPGGESVVSVRNSSNNGTTNVIVDKQSVIASGPGGTSVAVGSGAYAPDYRLRGSPRPIPALPTAISDISLLADGSYLCSPFDPPRTFVACIVMPPAKKTIMFYRMIVEWTIEFTGIRSVLDALSANNQFSSENGAYFTNYSVATVAAAKTSDLSSDALDVGFAETAGVAELEKVMER